MRRNSIRQDYRRACLRSGFGDEVHGLVVVADVEGRADCPGGAGRLESLEMTAQILDRAVHEHGPGAVAFELLARVLVGAADEDLAAPCDRRRTAQLGGKPTESLGRQAPSVPSVRLRGGDASRAVGVAADPRRHAQVTETATAVDELPGALVGWWEADAIGQVLVAVVAVAGAQAGDEAPSVEH